MCIEDQHHQAVAAAFCDRGEDDGNRGYEHHATSCAEGVWPCRSLQRFPSSGLPRREEVLSGRQTLRGPDGCEVEGKGFVRGESQRVHPREEPGRCLFTRRDYGDLQEI